MTKEQLMNNLYEIIAEHIEELAYENGASIYLTDKNELYIDLNNSEQVFVLNVKEEKYCIVELINENIGNNVEENEKFILIS